MRALLSEAATLSSREQEESDDVLLIADVARAYFEAPITRDVCVELPDEALEPHERGKGLVAKMSKCLYGTRDAAAGWQAEVNRVMLTNGFTAGVYNPCTYFHKKKQVRVLVH